MTFNSKGKLARFYVWSGSSGCELPDDLCTYFWGMVGRVAALLLLTVFLLVIVTGTVIGIVDFVQFAGRHKVIALLIGIGCSVVAFMIWKKRSSSEVIREASEIVLGKISGVKNRYCPRIEWR